MSRQEDSIARARAITAGDDATPEEIDERAFELRVERRFDVLEELLVDVARRALYVGQFGPEGDARLAATLREHGFFGYARRLLERSRVDGADSPALRREHALCTCDDPDLPARRRLDLALTILTEGEPLHHSASAETFAAAGAIFRAKWQHEGRLQDLETARRMYIRGFEQDDPARYYVGLDAALVCDELGHASQQDQGTAGQAKALFGEASAIRSQLVHALSGETAPRPRAAVGEALYCLGHFNEAAAQLAKVRAVEREPWKVEALAVRLVALARIHALTDAPEAQQALNALLGRAMPSLQQLDVGKVGLALSGGGFRAALFHVGVLARLAERDLLRPIEVLSCVSGGSIVGAHYYLKLHALLASKPDAEITADDYVELVRALISEFLVGVRQGASGRLFTSPAANLAMLGTDYSRTSRLAEVFDELFLSNVPAPSEHGWRMSELHITPPDRIHGFSARHENWSRAAKVPLVVFNATTLNTGHTWQFTPSRMGEPPVDVDEQADRSLRLRSVLYRDAPAGHAECSLAFAVAASAAVPGLFPPLTLDGLYQDLRVELLDGSLSDTHGIAALLQEGCHTVMMSDGSVGTVDVDRPSRTLVGVVTRSSGILLRRVREEQYMQLAVRRRSGGLRRLLLVHLKSGMPLREVDGLDAPDPRGATAYTQPPPSPIHPDVQKMLADVRTDFDAFADGEAHALMAAGYVLAGHQLASQFPEAEARVAPRIDAGWPFEDWIAELAKNPRDSAAASALAAGSGRFFRQARARGRPQPRNAQPISPRQPAASALKVVGAPFALVGAVIIRLVRWERRP